MFSGALAEASRLSGEIAEPEEETSPTNAMPLASFESRQQQIQGVRRFSKTTKKEGTCMCIKNEGTGI